MKILFLCVANSARSQIAEGLAKVILGEDVEIESAGSEPSGQVHPWAIETLKRQGINISKNWSKDISQLPPDFLRSIDYVITLCADEICPVLLLPAKRLHWPIHDPAMVPEHLREKSFQSASEEIKQRLELFKAEIYN